MSFPISREVEGRAAGFRRLSSGRPEAAAAYFVPTGTLTSWHLWTRRLTTALNQPLCARPDRHHISSVWPPVDAEDLRKAATPSMAGIRLIVVDDEADVRGAVSGLLQQAGAEVLALESGASIDAAIADFHPHVLVLDIGMPGEDGYALIRRIRRLAKSAGGDTPAISLTAHARDEDRRHAMELGFQAHLAKPVNVAQLLTTISRIASEPGNLQGETPTNTIASV